jgi:hypothetical protein
MGAKSRSGLKVRLKMLEGGPGYQPELPIWYYFCVTVKVCLEKTHKSIIHIMSIGCQIKNFLVFIFDDFSASEGSRNN